MSASPVARQAVAQAIPVSRRVVVNNESELPNDLSSTPGGSLFSTTPGGTRVYYDRSFLLSMRNSPMARTPPANLPIIKGVTVPDDRSKNVIEEENANYVDSDEEGEGPNRGRVARLSNSSDDAAASAASKSKEDDDQFQLDL